METRFRISAKMWQGFVYQRTNFRLKCERYFKVPRGRVPFVTKELQMSSITSQNVVMSLSN